jgi:hypothetical protein
MKMRELVNRGQLGKEVQLGTASASAARGGGLGAHSNQTAIARRGGSEGRD